jgi:hypothetical protein
MNRRAGWVVSAGLLLATTAAHAVTLASTRDGRPAVDGPAVVKVSDFGGPSYAELPPEGPMMPRYGGAILPPEEIYAVLRETGFSPLGIPRLRGAIYVISALDRAGDDGRLFIDARSGRILSFMPAYHMGENYREDLGSAYGAYQPQAAPAMPAARSAAPRPPASIPYVASRAMPMPQPMPPVAAVPRALPPPAAAERPPEPAPPRAAAVESQPLAAAAPASPPPAAVGQARPAPQILPTQPMPQAQDLE